MRFLLVFGQCRSVCSLFLIVAVLSAVCSAGTYSGGDGRSAATAYVISKAADWVELTNTPADWVAGKYFVLDADIELEGATIEPVGKNLTTFRGWLDGRGHAVRDFEINQAGIDYAGLFGYVGTGGQIRNLRVESFTISAKDNVGGLCGYNYEGTITASWAVGEVAGGNRVGGLCGYNQNGTISDSHAGGTVSGSYYVGGLCGQNYSSSGKPSVIVASCATGSVTGSGLYYVGGLCGSNDQGTISSSYATGAVTNGSSIGGLCGDNSGTISASYAAGAVTGGTNVGGLVGQNNIGKVIHCYSTGKPTGSSNVGGLCGRKIAGVNYEDTGNFWDTESSEMPTSVMGTGKISAEMKTLSTFAAASWDFETVWAICEPTNYPRLRWQILLADLVCPDGVGLEDLAHLASWWLEVDCEEAQDCEGADMDVSGKVDLADFAILAEQWAEGL